MISEKHNFKKITHFITDSYNNLPKQGVIIVKSVRNGFMVNNLLVKQSNGGWEVQSNDKQLSSFRQRRTAIIFAALVCKKRYFESNNIVGLDRQLDICLEDKNNFAVRIKKSNNQVLVDRLSRTENELELIEQQLQELEKSLSLQ